MLIRPTATLHEPTFETGLLLAGDVRPADVRRQLSRWTAAGKLFQLRRGLYALAPPYRKVQPHPFLIANRLVPASYVSGESALAHHGLIPEHVPVTVTPSRAQRRRNAYGSYDFRNMKRSLFWGAELLDVGNGLRAFVGRPEKALLDLVHLTDGGGTEAHLRGLRLQNLERVSPSRVESFADRAGTPKLRGAARILVRLIEEDRQEEERP